MQYFAAESILPSKQMVLGKLNMLKTSHHTLSSWESVLSESTKEANTGSCTKRYTVLRGKERGAIKPSENWSKR